MKKILLGIGAVSTLAAPIVIVISCGNDSSNNEAQYAKDIKTIANAFNATSGGKDISKEWKGISTEIERINSISVQVTKDKELKTFYKTILPTLKDITMGNTNKINEQALLNDVSHFEDFFSNTLTTIKSITESSLADYGLKSMDERTKVEGVISALDGVTKATIKDANSISIGQTLKQNSDTVIEGFYQDKAKNVSSSFKNVSEQWTAINALTGADKDAEEKIFILTLGKKLASEVGPNPGGPSNKFVSTTEGSKISSWLNMFNEIHAVAGSFSNDASAQTYGFTGLSEADAAESQADAMRSITKSPDVAGDATAITI